LLFQVLFTNAYPPKVNLNSEEFIKIKINWLIQKKRIKDLDEIPSPYLTGVLDKFFDGKLAPFIETNRGCPFTCSFAIQAQTIFIS